jgi:CBS domain-containing protein
MVMVKDILEVMTREIPTISPDETVYAALEKMSDSDRGCLVVTEEDKMVGTISETVYSREIMLKGRSSKECQVSEIMTRKVPFIREDNTLDECRYIMQENNVKYLPVMRGENVVGLLSLMDILRFMIKEKEAIIESLENYIYDISG